MNIGGQEIVVIFIVALLVFGPKRLPEIARFLAKAVREFRRAVDEIKHDIEHNDTLKG
jgi:TatA/E family protein of Tat protein translocase